jgi:hypothetical protein
MTMAKSLVMAALLAVVLSTAGVAATPAVISSTPVTAPDGTSPAELVRFDRALLSALAAVRPEHPVTVAGWPVRPGVRGTVALTRHLVMAPGARIMVVKDGTVREVPASPRVHLWGKDLDDPAVRVMVSLDPGRGTVHGLAFTPEGVFEIVEPEGRGTDHMVVAADARRGANEPPVTWGCGQEALPLEWTPPPLGLRSPATPEELRTAVVAVDTDNELMAQKFNNDTGAATAYVADLFAAMNVMYERDLEVRLLQGTTYLRIDPDPWVQQPVNGMASEAQLDEFGDYWSANYGGVNRALAMMLSGKSPSAYSSSGIAWLVGLCSSSYGYSFTLVFKIDYLAGDAMVVGHELGHNFGSPHTHCYTPPIDTCYSGEPGCYVGPTSCPTGGGTVMSYCHLLGGCSSSLVFHPRVITLLDASIASAMGVCIFPAGPSVTAVSPGWGSVAGGDAVTVTGSGFVAGASVTFGGSAATAVEVTDDSTLTAVTPAHAAGAVDVTVTNPDAESATLSSGFTFRTVVPDGLSVDAEAAAGSTGDLDGVLEPGEAVVVAPSWQNLGGSSVSATGSASAWGGPAATYSLLDGTASYGTITPGASRDCFSATGNCYVLGVSNPATRPVLHWDAVFTENLSASGARQWVVHVGGSFADVPRSFWAYRFIETMLHNGITAGCGGGAYCPATTVTRWQMAVFLSKAMSGGEVPTSGTVPGMGDYDCRPGGTSVFADVPPEDPGCAFIHYVAAQGVTVGCGGGAYCPATTVTRWQMGVFLAKAMTGNAVPPSGTVPGMGDYDCRPGGVSVFGDVPPDDPGCPFIHYLAAHGVTAGCGGGDYCPGLDLARDQMAVLMTKAFDLRLYDR